MKRIIIAVTNDLVADQRVHRIASTLQEAGMDVLLVGRRLPSSPQEISRTYKTYLLKLPFKKGVLFYANYNLALFFYLLRNKTDVILANDLDTLPACFFASKLKRKTLIFDSHEYFPEVPELVNRKGVRKAWLAIEKFIVPKLKYCYTVCGSISELYKVKYNIHFEVIRNLPFRKNSESQLKENLSSGCERIIMYQGSLNVGRGIELVIDAMKYLDNARLIIAGTGDIIESLKEKANQDNLHTQIQFLGRLPLEELHRYTSQAHIGFSLEENLGLNYYFALPNKLFDYIQSGIPVLVSDFPEMGQIVKHYNIGEATLERTPEKLAQIIEGMLTNIEKRAIWKENLKTAANDLCWENEREILLNLYTKAGLIG